MALPWALGLMMQAMDIAVTLRAGTTRPYGIELTFA